MAKILIKYFIFFYFQSVCGDITYNDMMIIRSSKLLTNVQLHERSWAQVFLDPVVCLAVRWAASLTTLSISPLINLRPTQSIDTALTSCISNPPRSQSAWHFEGKETTKEGYFPLCLQKVIFLLFDTWQVSTKAMHFCSVWIFSQFIVAFICFFFFF